MNKTLTGTLQADNPECRMLETSKKVCSHCLHGVSRTTGTARAELTQHLVKDSTLIGCSL